METTSFDQLPKSVNQLHDRLNRIEQLLLNNTAQQPASDCWFNLNELCNYLPDKPAKATVYAWVHHNTIPHHKKTKKLQFLRSEVDAWLKSGRKKTQQEIKESAHSYLQSPKKGGSHAK